MDCAADHYFMRYTPRSQNHPPQAFLLHYTLRKNVEIMWSFYIHQDFCIIYIEQNQKIYLILSQSRIFCNIPDYICEMVMCELIALSARTPRSLCDSMMKAVVKQYNSECYNSVQNTISCKFNEVLLQKLNNSIELQLFIIHVRQM